MSSKSVLPEVTFALLGSLAVAVGGVPIAVGAAKMRIVLASLLLRRGEVVSVDTLVDRLWGDEPPPGARNAVQTYIRRLRTLLGAGGDVIRTSAPGYFLDVPAEAVDLERFRLHLSRARAAALDGDTAIEDSELKAALALWRGAPLSDVDCESLQRDEAPLLIEERLEAVESRGDLGLRLGRHAELIAELRALTSEFPLREHLWQQLMLALYRSHRQAEALSVYRQVSTLLRDELGVDPGSELTELHRRILGGDLALHGGRPTTKHDRPAPCQLPPQVHDFVGRSELVELVRGSVTAAGDGRCGLPLIVFSGPPGVGKTELAVHVAYQLRDSFPDGQLFVNLRGFSSDPTLRADEVLGGFLRALGLSAEHVPPHLDERSAMFRSMLAERRVLLVLDNAGSPDQVRPLLPGGTTCVVIVTSRDSLVGLSAVNGGRRIPINPVTRSEAEDLVARIVGPERTAAEPGAVADLAAACGFLPLALRIAASNLAAIPNQRIASYVEELRSEDPLLAFTVEGDDQATVRATFDLSYRALRPEAAKLFRSLGLVPGPSFDHNSAAAVAGVSPTQARRTLASLITANLVEHHSTDRYQFHDLLREYAGWQAVREDDAVARSAAVRRLLDYYIYMADAAARLLYADFARMPRPAGDAPTTALEWTDPLEALGWLESEEAALVATVLDPLLRESGAPVWLLADSLHGYFVRQRQDAAWSKVLGAALDAAERAGDLYATAALQRGLGRLHFRHNEYAEARAWYSRSAALSQQLGDRAGEGRDLSGLAAVTFEVQDYEGAARYFEWARPMLRESGDLQGEAVAVVNLGLTLIMIGRNADGAETLGEARRLADKLHLRNVGPRATAGLAMLRSWKGDEEQATAQFQSVLSAWSELGYVQGQAETLRNLAEVHLQSGRPGMALDLAGQALKLAERVGVTWMAIGARITLAEAHLALGDFDAARAQLFAAAAPGPSGGGYWYPYAQAGLAACHRAAGDYRQSADLAREVVGNQRPRLRARANIELALTAVAAGDRESAARYAMSAEGISRRYAYRPDESRAQVILESLLTLRSIDGK